MKKLLAFFLLASFLAQTSSQAFIVGSYYINTASFAKNCENKNKPALKCNGRCQMMKKLKEEQKKEEENRPRRAEYENIVISSRSFFATAPSLRFISLPLNTESITSFPVDRAVDIFHPPQL